MKINRYIYMLLAASALLALSSCYRDEIFEPVEYEEGLATRISLRIGVPERSIATRADMPDGMDDEVRSLWVGIFSKTSGKCTYAKLYKDDVPAQLQRNHGNFAKLDDIKTVSGPSYIVAVGNPVDNYGYQYNPQGQMVSRQSLDTLLPATTDAASSFTWEDYKNIAIRQLALNDVNTPIGNLVMSGIYYPDTDDPSSAKSWEDANYTSVDIPTLQAGKTVTLKGAVHLRRLISQVKFKIQAVDYNGQDNDKRAPVKDPETEETISETRRILQIIPQSFQVKNVPYTSWLHERKAASSAKDIWDGQYKETNSGDVIRLNSSSISYSDADLPLKANYRTSAWFNGSQYLIPHYETNENGVQNAEPSYYTFDFWMLENKRWASYDLQKDLSTDEDPYDRREKEIKTDLSEKVGYDYEMNTGIYTALCSSDPDNPPTEVLETMNNCASFVEIRCRIIYTDDGLDAIKNQPDYNEVEFRSAEAIYTIHLGGIGQNWNDFTHRRNHKYTYNVTVMDIDRIIVEARFDDEPRPGIEGVVTDVVNPPFEVDCHNAVFNIQMSNLERTGGGIIQKEGDTPNTGGNNGDHDVNGGKYERGVFPFRIRYYDKDNFARYIDQNNINDQEYQTEEGKLYWTWVEFRPTTGPDVIADYKPYDYDWDNHLDDLSKGKTFRLNEVHDIVTYRHPEDDTNSKTYPGRPDEDDTELRWYTVFVNEYVYETDLDEGENNFVNYVNLSPRMCWINTLFRSSIDDESNYIRSKYVVRQPSIQSFYANIPYAAGDKLNNFNAIGMEHINETFGFNLRWDDIPTEFPGDDRTHNLQNNNGRHNTILYVFDDGHMTRGQDWNEYMYPNRLQYITDINTDSNQYDASYQLKEAPYLPDGHKKREPYYVPAIYTYTGGNSLGTSDINKQHFLRILDACMNRNRDNNGNGKIDLEEIRWYVPASSEIIDFVLGRNSLETPLLDYNLNYKLDSPAPTTANDIKVEQKHQANTRFHYATSNQRVLWAEEGATINPEVDVLTGTWNLPPQNIRCVRALGTNLETDSNADLTPAFTTNAVYTTGADGKRNYSSYATEIYPTYYEQKNQRPYTSDALDPHQEMTTQNRLCYYGFEFSKELFNFRPTTIQVWVEQGERTIPEGWYADDGSGEYLGIPEWKEGGGTRHDGGMYLPDPDSYSPDPAPGKKKFDGFWVGGEDYGGHYYKPDMTKYGGDDPNNEPTDGKYAWWDEIPVEETMHDGAWYRPDVTQYGGNGQEPDKEGKFDWWKEEELPVESTKNDGAWYEPDVTTYGGASQNPPTDGKYAWWDRFPDEESYHETDYYEPDVTGYGGNNQNNKPGDGYGWWETFTIGGTAYGPGYYWPNVNDGPYEAAPNSDYVKIDEDFGDDYYGPGNYTLITSSYTTEAKWGYAYFAQPFWDNGVQYAAGYYELSRGGSFWYNGPGYWVGERHPAGFYGRDISRKIENSNPPVSQLPWGYAPLPQYTTTLVIGGTTYPAGWYKPDINSKHGDQYNAPQPIGNYKKFEGWYDKYYEAGWYQPDKTTKTNVGNPGNNPKNSNPKAIHQWFDTWYDEYYPEGWYKPDLTSKAGDQWNNPNNNATLKNYHWFDTWYDKYYPAGWYQPDLATEAGDQYNRPNPMGNYKWFDEWHEGGTYYQEGYYGPDPASRTTDGNNFWNADPRYKRFETFWDSPAGYYGSDGSYLGPNRNSAPDPAWADKNPKWVDEHKEPVPEGGAYEDKFVEGLWQDASGATRDLFSYNEGNFVRDHGTTLAAANKICQEDMNEKGYGNGWRLPTMKEASLIKIAMDNAGVYKGLVRDDYLTYEKFHDPVSGYDVGNFIACTFREFGVTEPQSRAEQDGYYTGIYYAENPDEVQPGDWSGAENASPVLGRIACITTGYNRHFYIRCVRDLPSATE